MPQAGFFINNGNVFSSRNFQGLPIRELVAIKMFCSSVQCFETVGWMSVCLSVGLSVTVLSPAKAVEPIGMLFGLRTWVGPKKHVLVGGAHWRHLANIIILSVCGSDAPVVKSL